MYTQSVSTSERNTTVVTFRQRMKGWFNNLLVTLVGLIVGFIISEIALAFLKPPPVRWLYPQTHYLPDKELGWVMKANQHSYTHDHPMDTNSLGLRSPEINSAKQPGALRVICLGDSQTFGNGVAQEQTFAARLESLLRSRMPGRAIDVINAGIAGYDTVQEVKLLERIAPSLKPDIVVVGFYLNDIVEVLQPKNRYVIDAESGEFQRTGLLKQFTPYRLIYLLKRSRVVTFLYWNYLVRRWNAEVNIQKAVLLGKTAPQLEPAWPVIEKTLLHAETLGKELGFKVIVFPVPAGSEFFGDHPHEQYRSRLISVAEKLGLGHFDPTPQMKAAGGEFDKYFIQWDGHINPATHNLIAELLAPKVTALLKPVS